MFHFRTHKSPYLALCICHYYGPSLPPTLVKCCLVWLRNDPSIIHWWLSLLLLLLLLLFFREGEGGLVFVKASACTSFILPLSWKYTTERPFFLTVSFQDYIISSMALYYNIISYVFFLPGPTLTIEGTCIQLSSGVRIFWSRSRSALLIGFPFTGKDTIWHLWDPKNRSNRNKNVYGDLL